MIKIMNITSSIKNNKKKNIFFKQFSQLFIPSFKVFTICMYYMCIICFNCSILQFLRSDFENIMEFARDFGGEFENIKVFCGNSI